MNFWLWLRASPIRMIVFILLSIFAAIVLFFVTMGLIVLPVGIFLLLMRKSKSVILEEPGESGGPGGSVSYKQGMGIPIRRYEVALLKRNETYSEWRSLAKAGAKIMVDKSDAEKAIIFNQKFPEYKESLVFSDTGIIPTFKLGMDLDAEARGFMVEGIWYIYNIDGEVLHERYNDTYPPSRVVDRTDGKIEISNLPETPPIDTALQIYKGYNLVKYRWEELIKKELIYDFERAFIAWIGEIGKNIETYRSGNFNTYIEPFQWALKMKGPKNQQDFKYIPYAFLKDQRGRDAIKIM